MELYYTNVIKAMKVADELKCCGYEVAVTFDGETYTLTVRMP